MEIFVCSRNCTAKLFIDIDETPELFCTYCTPTLGFLYTIGLPYVVYTTSIPYGTNQSITLIGDGYYPNESLGFYLDGSITALLVDPNTGHTANGTGHIQINVQINGVLGNISLGVHTITGLGVDPSIPRGTTTFTVV